MNVQDKVKQREALENAYENFVEPHVNQLIEVKVESPMVPVVPSTCFCYVSGWLVLTVFYCLWVRFWK